eukprot:scaffold2764_cov399-Prasinococcus_capsulatus_cf.AAC.4
MRPGCATRGRMRLPRTSCAGTGCTVSGVAAAGRCDGSGNHGGAWSTPRAHHVNHLVRLLEPTRVEPLSLLVLGDHRQNVRGPLLSGHLGDLEEGEHARQDTAQRSEDQGKAKGEPRGPRSHPPNCMWDAPADSCSTALRAAGDPTAGYTKLLGREVDLPPSIVQGARGPQDVAHGR